MFRKSDKSRLVAAIRKGDIAFLRELLGEHPEYLAIQIKYDGGWTGTALHIAASFNRPDVIGFLVEEMKVPVDQRESSTVLWGALHFACHSKWNAYQAVEKLLALGADPQIRLSDGRTPLNFCESVPIIELLDSARAEWIVKKSLKQQEKEKTEIPAAETWALTSPAEVMHETSTTRYCLTDVFNFETRRMVSITKDLTDGHLAQNIFFFDDIPDKTILHQAHEQYKGCGGKIAAETIERLQIRKSGLGS